MVDLVKFLPWARTFDYARSSRSGHFSKKLLIRDKMA